MISEMTLSDLSHFPGFFSPRKVNLKIPINSGLGQARIACSQEMTLSSWFIRSSFQIEHDDFPASSNKGKMTYRDLANSGLS
jgi:hypothetical protein